MFQATLNELRVTLDICPCSPLIVKEGRHFERKKDEIGDEWKKRMFFHQNAPRTPPIPKIKKGKGHSSYTNADDCFNMACVYTQDAQGIYRFYLPGSSIHGVMRTTAERIVGRWRPDLAQDGTPFDNAAEEWTQQQRDNGNKWNGDATYANANPLDRCFGHTALRGRWRVADAWMQNDQEANVVVRDSVGINRQTGAAQNKFLFQFEAITGGTFTTTITLVNYELWQLGLLAHVLATLDSGEMRLGYGTRRGLGHVRVRVAQMAWRWYQKHQPVPSNDSTVLIPSLATLAQTQGLPDAYGWQDGALPQLALPLTKQHNGGLVPDWVWVAPNQETDWDGEPWSMLGPLLPSVIQHWNTLEQKQEVAG
jgi:CRISPR/Cas system CSM-associated protein Csm3 (group 7 of RAMP superfamily)